MFITGYGATSAAERIVAQVRQEIIGGLADGEHLGSAEELAERFEVSVPTVRQALRVLQAEGLVWVRRGNSGGYFASTPSVRLVSRSASALLQRQGTEFRDLLGCAQLIGPEIAALAAASPDAAQRHALADYIEAAWAGHDHDDVGVNLHVTAELGRRLGELCANPALALFSAVLTDLALDVTARYLHLLPPERVTQYATRGAEGQLLLARAVREGNVPLARQAEHLINTGLTL